MLLFEECKVRWREDGVGKNQLWNKNPKSVLVTNLFAAFICAINLHYHVFFSFLFFPSWTLRGGRKNNGGLDFTESVGLGSSVIDC